MYGDEALLLVREARRAGANALSPYNDEIVRHVIREVDLLMEVSRRPDPKPTLPELVVSHASISRNRRCLLAYFKHRTDVIRNTIWQTGALPPDELRANMAPAEVEFTRRYNAYVQRVARERARASGTKGSWPWPLPRSLAGSGMWPWPRP